MPAGLVCSANPASFISESFSSGSVYGKYDVGGLVPHSKAHILNSYPTSTDSSKGAATASLVASAYSSSQIQNCFATGRVTGNNRLGGMIGYCDLE